MQVVLSHHPPDLVLAHIAQMLGQQPSVPAAVACRRRLIERLQDPLFGNRSVFATFFCRARAIVKASNFSRAKHRSHLLTRASRVPIFKAISLPLSPLEAKRITLARSTMRCSVLELRSQRKRISFSSAESRISGARRLM